jgi:hypothetical protein
MGIETEAKRFAAVTSQGCSILSGSRHISDEYSGVL